MTQGADKNTAFVSKTLWCDKSLTKNILLLWLPHLLDNQLYNHHLCTWNGLSWRLITHKTPFWKCRRSEAVQVYVWARLWMGAILWRSTTQCCDGRWWIDAARSHSAVARRRLPHKSGSYVAGGSIELIATCVWVRHENYLLPPIRPITEQSGSISNASDLSLGAPQFDSQPGHYDFFSHLWVNASTLAVTLHMVSKPSITKHTILMLHNLFCIRCAKLCYVTVCVVLS